MKYFLAVTAAVALAASVSAQTQTQAQTKPVDHYTFSVSHGTARFDLTVRSWASEAERTTLTNALDDGGSRGFEHALTQMPDAGYLSWTDGLEYIVRYAYRFAVPGGDDIVLAMDHPLTFYWDPNIESSTADEPYTVVQFHLSEDGRGEGKVATNGKVVAVRDSITAQDFAAQPTVMTDVQRVAADRIARGDVREVTGAEGGI